MFSSLVSTRTRAERFDTTMKNEHFGSRSTTPCAAILLFHSASSVVSANNVKYTFFAAHVLNSTTRREQGAISIPSETLKCVDCNGALSCSFLGSHQLPPLFFHVFWKWQRVMSAMELARLPKEISPDWIDWRGWFQAVVWRRDSWRFQTMRGHKARQWRCVALRPHEFWGTAYSLSGGG